MNPNIDKEYQNIFRELKEENNGLEFRRFIEKNRRKTRGN